MTDSNDIDRNAPASPLFPDEEIAREEALMFEKRLRAYRSIGYEPSGHPPWE